MKVVFDTNVIISTFVFKGFSAKVYEYCIREEEIHLSGWILKEVERILIQKFNIEEQIVFEILNLIKEKVTITEPAIEEPKICRDVDDNKILQLSDYVKAEFIITGDKDLLELIKYKGAMIVNPREFYSSIIEKK